MNRRNFLKAAMASGALYSAGGLPILGREVFADGFANVSQRVLVNLMLGGGPDFRHLLPPAFDVDPTSYGYRYWEAKAGAHSIEPVASAYQARWDNDYFHINDGDTTFGILKSCGWLKSMWDAGNVAFIHNAIGSPSRDHVHSQLVMEQGDTRTGRNDYDKSGWGGRLAAEAGGNVLALTKAPSHFCYGPDPEDPNGYDNRTLITAKNTRNISFYEPASELSVKQWRRVLTRSLSSYYAAKRQEMPVTSPYRQFVELEKSIRVFGDLINDRLESVPLPASIEALYQGGVLNNGYLGEQIRNLYDSLACADLLSLRVASMEFGSWDSHKDQVEFIEPKLEDMFGNGKAFDVLYQELPANAADNMVLVLAGEFGRQLQSNGANGCDHGRGTTMMVIGNSVRGGIYGDMFPASEIARFDVPGSDIVGLTEIDHVFGQVCDWMVPGGGSVVFPNRASAAIETDIGLDNLFGV